MLLIPTLQDFFKAHPPVNPKTFLGDSAFDAVGIYKALLAGDTFGMNCCFQKAYIPLNRRAGLENNDYSINQNGVLCCPNDPSLTMKTEGNTSHLRCRLPSFKFVCPKMKWQKCDDGEHRRGTYCQKHCTSSACGRMVHVYPEKKTCGLFPERFAIRLNGRIPTKYAALSNALFFTFTHSL